MTIMPLNRLPFTLVALCALGPAVGAVLHLECPASATAADKPASEPAPQAVEADMHHFMEYLVEPAYLRLQKGMAAAPDSAGWKAIKGDSLLLAESTNLLFARLPKENAGVWKQTSAEVRAQGAALYEAAKKKDFAAGRKSYEAMIGKCNACHEQFHKGEPVLKP